MGGKLQCPTSGSGEGIQAEIRPCNCLGACGPAGRWQQPSELLCSAPPSHRVRGFAAQYKTWLSVFSELFRPPGPACTRKWTHLTAALKMYILSSHRRRPSSSPEDFCGRMGDGCGPAECEGPLSCLRLRRVVTQRLGTLGNCSGRFKRAILKAVGEYGGRITESKLSACSSSARCVNKESLCVSFTCKVKPMQLCVLSFRC